MLEQELKLTVEDPAILPLVLEQPYIRALLSTEIGLTENSGVAQEFYAIYYDSEGLDLEARRCSLRARREGPNFRAAFKLPGHIENGLSVREEFEVDITRWLATVDDLPPSELRDQVCELISPQCQLIERVKVDMTRQVYFLKDADTLIELVLDSGIIYGTDGQQDLSEIELELKSGSVESILSLGALLQSNLPLVPSFLSKHRIGLNLCERRYEA